MAFRYRSQARRRALMAGLVGAGVVAIFGAELVLPALALVSLVYYAHQVAAVWAGDAGVAYPSLALVIVLNSLVVLAVQALLFVEALRIA